jgi:hypothetical protein
MAGCPSPAEALASFMQNKTKQNNTISSKQGVVPHYQQKCLPILCKAGHIRTAT